MRKCFGLDFEDWNWHGMSTYFMHVVLKKPRYQTVQSPLTSVTERGRSVRSFLAVHH